MYEMYMFPQYCYLSFLPIELQCDHADPALQFDTLHILSHATGESPENLKELLVSNVQNCCPELHQMMRAYLQSTDEECQTYVWLFNAGVKECDFLCIYLICYFEHMTFGIVSADGIWQNYQSDTVKAELLLVWRGHNHFQSVRKVAEWYPHNLFKAPTKDWDVQKCMDQILMSYDKLEPMDFFSSVVMLGQYWEFDEALYTAREHCNPRTIWRRTSSFSEEVSYTARETMHMGSTQWIFAWDVKCTEALPPPEIVHYLDSEQAWANVTLPHHFHTV